jgi:hypothetical protein
MVRSMLLHAKVDYCPVVHGGCGEPLEWTPSMGAAAGRGPATDVEEGDDSPSFLEATCGSCGHHWSLPPGVT